MRWGLALLVPPALAAAILVSSSAPAGPRAGRAPIRTASDPHEVAAAETEAVAGPPNAPPARPVLVRGVVLDAGTLAPVPRARVFFRRFLDPASAGEPELEEPEPEPPDEFIPCVEEFIEEEEIPEEDEEPALSRPWPVPRPPRSVPQAVPVNRDGRFSVRLEGGPGACADLVASAPGFQPRLARFRLSEESGSCPRLLLERSDARTVEVLHEDGGPVMGAEVRVYASRESDPHAVHITDREGRARVWPPGGRGHLLVSAPGMTQEWIDVDEDWLVVLKAGFSIAGRVQASDGSPLPGVEVYLREGTACCARSSVAPVVSSGARGDFRFDHVSHGRCELHLGRDGYFPLRVCARSGDESLELTLYRPARISGLVVDPDGIPAAGATVSVRPAPDGLPLYGRRGETASDGSFHLPAAPPGRLHLSGWMAGDRETGSSRGSASCFAAEGGTVRDVLIQLRAGASSVLWVRAEDPLGRPLARVRVEPGASGHAQLREVLTDIRGEALLRLPVEAGAEVDLLLRAPEESGLDPRRMGVDLRSSAYLPDRPCPIRFPEYVDAVVQVLDGDRPWPDGLPLRLELEEWWDPNDEDAPLVSRSGPGRFVYRVNPRSFYSLTVQAEGFLSEYVSCRSPRADRPTVVSLRRYGALLGRFVDSDGRPAARAWASVLGETGGEVEAEVDAAGIFRLPRLTPGEHVLRAGRKPDRPEVVRTLEIRPGEELDAGVLVLAGDRLVTGRVTTRGGEPLGGAHAFVAGPGVGGRGLGPSTSSHGNGSFEIRVPGPSPGYLVVRKEPLALAAFALAKIDRRLDVRLRPAGRLRIDVRGDDGVVPQVGVPLDSGGGRLWLWACESFQGAGWTSGNLPPGEVLVRVESSGGWLTKEALVREGESTTVVFDLGGR